MAECCLDFPNDSCVLWHQAIDAKYHGKGKPFAGEDFDKMLWRYDVGFELKLETSVNPVYRRWQTHRAFSSWTNS
jgi:hypothetical protein